MKKKIVIAALTLCSVVAIFFYFQFYSQNVIAMQNTQLKSEHLKATDFQAALKTGSFTLLDIRTIEEYKAGHIKGAKQIDFYQTEAFINYLQTLERDKNYLIYCRSGHRSGLALVAMKKMGFTNAADLEGGYSSWTANKLPVEK
jgi:rhodanese-related sulfurtransferase